MSIPSRTSLTSKSTSIEPEIGFRPVFFTVKLTNRLPSPIIAAPVAGSYAAGAMLTSVIPTSSLSRLRTERKSPAPAHP